MWAHQAATPYMTIACQQLAAIKMIQLPRQLSAASCVMLVAAPCWHGILAGSSSSHRSPARSPISPRRLAASCQKSPHRPQCRTLVGREASTQSHLQAMPAPVVKELQAAEAAVPPWDALKVLFCVVTGRLQRHLGMLELGGAVQTPRPTPRWGLAQAQLCLLMTLPLHKATPEAQLHALYKVLLSPHATPRAQVQACCSHLLQRLPLPGWPPAGAGQA